MSGAGIPTLPEPPGPKKATNRRWLLPVATAVALLVGVGIGYAAGNQGSGPEGVVAADTVTITEQPIPTGPIAETGTTGATRGATGATSGAIGATAGAESSLDSPFPKGQSGEAFGWSVKVADFNSDANEVVEHANQFNAPPRKGVYAVVTLRFARTDGASEDPWANIDAALVVGSQTYTESDEACCLPDAWSDIGKVPTGGSAVGRIAFDVPKAGLDDAVLFLTITDPQTPDEAEGFFSVT